MEAKREISKRKMVGRVIKDKMDKTVVVEVESSSSTKYHKFIKRKLRYKAHDENIIPARRATGIDRRDKASEQGQALARKRGCQTRGTFLGQERGGT
jgi:hypothetical protein